MARLEPTGEKMVQIGRALKAGLGGVLVLLVACAAPQDRMVVLDDTLRAYERVLRWGNVAAAQQFQDVPEAIDPRRLQGLRVTGYDVLSKNLEPGGEVLTQTVALTYFREDVAVQRSLTDTQRWRFDAERGRWLLETRLPRFR